MMSSPVNEITAPALRMAYENGDAAELLAGPDVLALVAFGGTGLPDDPRALRVGLAPLGASPFEVWRASGPVESGRDGELAWSSDGEHAFFAIEVEETAHGGIAQAAAHAYRRVLDHVASSPTPYLLRLWNYFDAINLGEGDDERYRRFCEGRARALASGMRYPAATAIGRRDGVRTLQVYGLAARSAGTPVENPRQVSAWRYPRAYGPAAPSFARGLRTGECLLISGTAAVVGHASHHPGDLAAQLDETLANLDSLAAVAGFTRRFAGGSVLKAYVRHAADAAAVAAMLRQRLPALDGLVLLEGDICRRELLVEIDGMVHAP